MYFDDFQVGITTGNIIEENHYYAYGLKIATLSSRKLGDSYEGRLKNDYLYNDKELFDDADLNWYDYGFRFYDPQIGRFPQLDPLTFIYHYLTPYQYAGCEPIANIDIDGLEPGSAISKISSATEIINDLPTGALAVVKELKNVTLPVRRATSTVINTSKMASNTTGRILSAISNVNSLNTSMNANPAGKTNSQQGGRVNGPLVQSTPVTCHGAYQDGYVAPKGKAEYDGITFTGSTGSMGGGRKVNNPDPQWEDLSLFIKYMQSMSQSSAMDNIKREVPSKLSEVAEYLNNLKEMVKYEEEMIEKAEIVIEGKPDKQIDFQQQGQVLKDTIFKMYTLPDGSAWGGNEGVRKQVEDIWKKYKEKNPNSKKEMKTYEQKTQINATQ